MKITAQDEGNGEYLIRVDADAMAMLGGILFLCSLGPKRAHQELESMHEVFIQDIKDARDILLTAGPLDEESKAKLISM